MSGNRTADRVWALAEPVAASLGLSLWDVRFVKEGASWYLRIFVDKPEGVFIDDCVDLSHAMDPILDEEDFISQSYYLEVSSPGLGRELTRPEHFTALKGREIRVRLVRPVDGKRDFTGILESFDGASVTLMDGGAPFTFLKNDAAYIKLNDDNF